MAATTRAEEAGPCTSEKSLWAAARCRSRPAAWPSRPTARSSCATATPWCSSPRATRRPSATGIDFLPLTVDYREYTYASGRIPGGFFKREGKATEKEVLTSRCIDRPLRPLFPSGWHHETQVIALVLSADENYDPDVVAITGASAALAFSEIPFQKTLAGVRVGYVDGAFVINPTYAQRKQSDARHRRRRQHGRPGDGRGRREGSRRGHHRPGPRGRARRDQVDRGDDRRDGGGDRQAEGARSRRRRSTRRLSARSSRRSTARSRGDAHQGQARELRAGRRARRRLPGRRSRRKRPSGRPRPRRSSRNSRRR